MSFLEILWKILKMWQLWLCLVVMLLGSTIITVVVTYVALLSPTLSLVVLATGSLLVVTTVLWIIEKSV